jgi:hypothetical protein
MSQVMNTRGGELDGPSSPACQQCRRRDGLTRCDKCSTIYYCGRQCKAADRRDHKSRCGIITRARKTHEKKYLEIAPMVDDEGYTPNVPPAFAASYLARHRSPYMRARLSLVEKLLFHYGTAGGPAELVQEVLDHVLDMLRVERTDRLRVRLRIPALYIRLGREQEAYDFLKW